MRIAKVNSTLRGTNTLPTAPIPEDLKDTPIQLTENARIVLQKRYLRRGEDGKPAETEHQMFWRVAYHVALAELEFADHETVMQQARAYFELLTKLRFFPNSPTFTGAGTPLGQLAACFVLAIDDDMGRTESGIFQTLRNAALIQQTGGGNGFAFSRLRPKGALVSSSRGEATGPVGFLRVYDQAFGEIAQGGSRRGANMAVLRVDHPDIREFITCKTDESAITNFNISVGITDAFMRAVEDDGDFDLVNPQNGEVWETVRARDLFDLIVKQAHHNGEPGVLFLDTANRSNPVPHLYELESTNPCVTGDTLVATPFGWRRADSIREGDEICTVLGTGRVTTIEVNNAVPVFDVYFSDGGSVRVTAAHQFHARDAGSKFFEPRRLDELKIGDWVRVYRVAMPNNPVPQGSVPLEDRQYGFLVGLLVGDGTFTPTGLPRNVVRVSSHADEHEWNEIVVSTLKAVGVERVTTYVMEGSRSIMMDPKPGRVIASWVRSLPLKPALSREKELPECYINSNREFLTGLLDGLFSTDGSVDLSSNHPIVRFHTASSKLAEQVRQILLMFGVHGRIFKTIRKRHDINGRHIRNDRPKYDVVVSGESFGRFFEQIRLSHPEKQRRMEEAALMCNFTGGNWAARVVKIEPAGVERVYDLYEPRSDTWITNGYVSRGCGEQFLGPFENCCLGSLNLAQLPVRDGAPDWETLKDWTELATRFLDDVVSANSYVPAVPQLAEAAHRVRRIGLGFMGLADLMYKLNVRYGSEEGQEFAGQLTEFVRYHCMKTSIELAKERGAFPAIKGSIYDPDDLKWQPPTPLFPYSRDWKRPALDWEKDRQRHQEARHSQRRADDHRADRHHRHSLGLRRLWLRACLRARLHSPCERQRSRPAAAIHQPAL
jgi:ribonucleoside-diphosphate reductase alpha chain